MTKWVIKFLVMVAIVVGGANYMLYLKTGRSLSFSGVFGGLTEKISFRDTLKPSLPAEIDLLPKGIETAYKWTDENGVVHFSSDKPSDRESVEVRLDPNTNVIEGIPVARKGDKEIEGKPEPAVPELQNAYNPGAVRKLIEDAKDVQNKLNERYESLSTQ